MRRKEPTGELRKDVLDEDLEHGWLWNHIGRIAGMVLGLLAFSGVAFIAAIGYTPAFALMVLLVAGVAMIALGGRMRAR